MLETRLDQDRLLERDRRRGPGTGGRGTAAAAAGPSGAPSSSHRDRPLVLLVEDDPHDREIYGKTLWYNGFDVLHGEDGEDAVALSRRHVPDLVLVDLLLPHVNGIDACRRIKADPATADIPVMALTARAEREFGLLARDAGCMRYLEKPIGPLAVLKAVEEVVGRPPPPPPPA